ncbi:MAG: hypothetical protein LBV27_09480, partial [Oscillospiraceae bacterium]|nr:hypothetical protein [Oscillospiraceae bacterium]
ATGNIHKSQDANFWTFCPEALFLYLNIFASFCRHAKTPPFSPMAAFYVGWLCFRFYCSCTL